MSKRSGPGKTPQEQVLKNAYKGVLNEKANAKLQEQIEKDRQGLYVWSQTEGRLVKRQFPSTRVAPGR